MVNILETSITSKDFLLKKQQQNIPKTSIRYCQPVSWRCTFKEDDNSVHAAPCFTQLKKVRRHRSKCHSGLVLDPTKLILKASIPEDDRFKFEIQSEVNWVEIFSKLRHRQLPGLEPGELDSIHRTYTNLIDMKDTIHVFTMSQLLQFISVYQSFVKLKYNNPNAYLYCPIRFKCKSSMSLKVNEEKGLFYLSYVHVPTHTHTSAEIVEMAKSQIPKSQHFPVDIPEDKRFTLVLPSKVNWADLLPKLREPQPHELKPSVLDSIHRTYTNLIDMRDTIHVFTTSQFLQFITAY
ncbi:unnamed protein product [Ambrosiozyma monospora]|uniref:Unnamed protein product n=1 Tax=Ambrosiozyma monospora TaxID=43982 RepID=A0ACB5T5J4_AMBMO|nr:unnamed protein product [Ambrosiozyma monospora]